MNFWQTLSFLSMSLPVVQDDSLCTPIITWNSLTPPPHPKQYFPTHRLRFKAPLKHLKSQVIGQEICLNVYTNASFEWCTLLSLQFEQKKCYRRFQNEHHNLKKFWPFSADRIDRHKPVMIFAETFLLFLWKISQTEKPSWQQPSLFFYPVIIFQKVDMHRNVIRYESHDQPDLPYQKSIFIYKKHYYVPFYFANEKIFYAEQKWIENWTSLFCGKLDFWRGRSDTAAPCGHGFHNHHITCQLWPLQVTYDRATYGNTPYDQSLQPFLVEVGRIWKHRSISSIIISW